MCDNPTFDINKPVGIFNEHGYPIAYHSLPKVFIKRGGSIISPYLLLKHGALIRKLVAGFRRAGVSSSDCVCCILSIIFNYPIVVLGIIGAGGIFTGTNPPTLLSSLSTMSKVRKPVSSYQNPRL